MKPRIKIFYVDPQSYRNLAIYDYCLLQPIHDRILYIHSKYYDYKSLKDWNDKGIFSYNKKKNNIAKLASYIWSYAILLLLTIKHSPKVIHIQWFKVPVIDYLFVRIFRRVFHVKVVFTSHNILPLNTGHKYYNIYKKIYNVVNHVIVHNDFSKKRLITEFQLPEDKVSVIRHGILKLDIDKDSYKQQLPLFEKKYQLQDKIIFTSLGEQSKYKGIDVLAKVWLTTPKLNNNSNIKLLVIGKIKGINLDDLKKMPNVMVDNRMISNEEFYYLLKHTDVYLLPYREISQSGALLTALSVHTPVLVNNVGGLTEPLKVAKVGWSIPTLSEQNLRTSLIKLSRSYDEIQQVKKDNKAWEKIDNFYKWDSMSTDTWNVYKSLL